MSPALVVELTGPCVYEARTLTARHDGNSEAGVSSSSESLLRRKRGSGHTCPKNITADVTLTLPDLETGQVFEGEELAVKRANHHE